MIGHELYNILESIGTVAEHLMPGRIIPDYEAKIHTGETVRLPNGAFRVTYGLRGIYDDFDDVPDGEAMAAIIALCHEVYGRSAQEKYECDKDTPLAVVLGLNSVACYGSLLYYGGPRGADIVIGDTVSVAPSDATDISAGKAKFTKDYAKQPFELAARYMGMRAAYDHISVMYGEEYADKLALAYLERADSNRCNFISRDMALVETGMRLKSEDSSVSINKEMLDDKFKTEDALSAFEHKFQGCVFSKREHDVFRDPLSPMSVIVKAQLLSDRQIQMFEKCRNGVHQDLMMCTAAYYAMGGRRPSLLFPKKKQKRPAMFDRPVFDSFVWDIDYIFTDSPPLDFLPFCAEPRPLLRLSDLYDMTQDVPDRFKVDDPSKLPAILRDPNTKRTPDLIRFLKGPQSSKSSAKPKGPDLSL